MDLAMDHLGLLRGSEEQHKLAIAARVSRVQLCPIMHVYGEYQVNDKMRPGLAAWALVTAR